MEPQLYQYLNTLAEQLVNNAVQSQVSFGEFDGETLANSHNFRNLNAKSFSQDLNEPEELMIESDSETSEWEPPKRISVYVQTVKQKEPPATIALKRLLRTKDAKIKELEKTLLQVQTELELLKFSHLVKSDQVKEPQVRESISRSTPRSHDVSTAPVDERMSEMVFKSQKVSSAIDLELSSSMPISPSIHEIVRSGGINKPINKSRRESEEYCQQVMRDFVSPIDAEAEAEEKQSPEFAFMGREGAAEYFKDFVEYEIKDFNDMREVSIFDYPGVDDSSLYTLNPNTRYSPRAEAAAKKNRDEHKEILAHPAPIEGKNEEVNIPFPWLEAPADKKSKVDQKMKSTLHKKASKESTLHKKASRELSLSYFHEHLDLDLIDKLPSPHYAHKPPNKEKKTNPKPYIDKPKEILNKSIDARPYIKDKPRPFTQVDSKRPSKVISRPKTQSKPVNKSSSLPPIETLIPLKTSFEPIPKKTELRALSMKSKKRSQKNKPKRNLYTVENDSGIDDFLGYTEANEGEVWNRILYKMRKDTENISKVGPNPMPVKPKIPPPIKLVPLREHIADTRSMQIPPTSEDKRNIKEIKVKSGHFSVSYEPSNRTSKQESPKTLITDENSMMEMYTNPRSLTVIPVSTSVETSRAETRSARSTHASEMSLAPDWSRSALDNCASCGAVNFNLDKNPVLLSPTEIDELLRRNLRNELTTEEINIMVPRLKATIERLCAELLLSNSYANLSNMSEQAFGAILRQCKKFMRARKLTIDILCLIHHREEMLLRIISLPNQNSLQQEYKQLLSFSRSLLELVAQWKVSGLPYTKFIFLGNDYSNKVHEDNANILALFPNLQSSTHDYLDVTLTGNDFISS